MWGDVYDKFRLIAELARLGRHDRWSATHLADNRARKLAALRRFALARSPFYRRFHRGLEGAPLAELPVLTKSMAMEAFNDVATAADVRLEDV